MHKIVIKYTNLDINNNSQIRLCGLTVGGEDGDGVGGRARWVTVMIVD